MLIWINRSEEGLESKYGWRTRTGLMIPSSNITMGPEFNAMKPEGVSVHAARLTAEAGTVEGLTRMAKDTI